MRIALDALILHGRYAGVEHYVHQLIVALRRQDRENEYLVYVPRDAATREFNAENFAVRRAPFSGRQKVRRVMWQQLAMPSSLAAERVELLHGPAYVLPLQARCRRVVTVHDVIVFARPDLAKASNRWHYRTVVPRAVARADRVITLSRHARDALLRHLEVEPQKIVVSYQGVRETFCPVTDEPRLGGVRERYDLPGRFFLFVGQIEPKKNVMACIEAMREYARRGGPPAKLVIAGKIGWRARAFTRAIADPTVREHVRYVGYVDDEDLAALYSLAEALLFPSLYEGVGVPPLEAMACGCPAIVSDRAALPEVVGDAALVVPLPEDGESPSGRAAFASALARAMMRLDEDERLRADLVSRGLKRARRFSWARHAREVLDVYRHVTTE